MALRITEWLVKRKFCVGPVLARFAQVCEVARRLQSVSDDVSAAIHNPKQPVVILKAPFFVHRCQKERREVAHMLYLRAERIEQSFQPIEGQRNRIDALGNPRENLIALYREELPVNAAWPAPTGVNSFTAHQFNHTLTELTEPDPSPQKIGFPVDQPKHIPFRGGRVQAEQ